MNKRIGILLEDWQKEGRPNAGQMLRDRTETLLNRLKPPADHDKLIAAGEHFIRSLSDMRPE